MAQRGRGAQLSGVWVQCETFGSGTYSKDRMERFRFVCISVIKNDWTDYFSTVESVHEFSVNPIWI